jgi:hypothetical protein
MAVNIDGDGLIELGGTSTTQGRLRLKEDTDNGTNYVELQAPPNLASDVTFVLPDTDGTNGQALITNGSGALSFGTIPEGGDYVMQTFTAPGTWTKPAGLKKVKVTVVGGGGGSGNNNPALYAGGTSGGAGGASIRYIPAPSIPGPVTVTRGAGGAGLPGPNTNISIRATTGGTSSFGAFASATGGQGGFVNPGPLSPQQTAGGIGSSGDLNIRGGQLTSPIGLGLGGADSIFGGGGTKSGQAGLLGGGAGAPGPSGAILAGTAGGNGVIIVEEFY